MPNSAAKCLAFSRFKVTLFAGTLLLLIGAAALATGCLLPPKLEGIGEEEFMVLDQEAVEYNHALRICRAVGTVLCAIAGALLVTCVLSSALGRVNRGSTRGEEQEQLSPILRESPPRQWGTLVAATPVPFSTSCAQTVQPKREA